MPEAADILLAVLVRGKRIVRTGFKIKQPELRCEITLKILKVLRIKSCGQKQIAGATGRLVALLS